MKRFVFGSTLFFIVPLFLLSQWKSKEIYAVKVRTPIKIDGVIDETAWHKAEEADEFIQFQPERGQVSPFSTRVKILYDEKFIYFGFLCDDPEPGKIAARMTKRDSDVRSDDSVYVLIDTFHDRRSCYYVGVNLLGTQWDGRITENGRTFDSTWDGIWRAAAQKTEYGWSVEFAIDLSSIKYEPGTGKTWGLSLGRGIPRRLEFSFWTGPLESPYKVSQFGELKGFDLEKSKRKFQLIPHFISKLQEGEDIEVEGGADARWAISQMVSCNLTINPDFATVEADQEEINLTRFELSLPEKRNFFLEEADIYQHAGKILWMAKDGVDPRINQDSCINVASALDVSL